MHSEKPDQSSANAPAVTRRPGWLSRGGLAAAVGDESASDWERPTPDAVGYRADALGAVAFTLISLLMLALMESHSGLIDGTERWWGYAIVASITLPLIWRRQYPVVVLAFTTTGFIVGSYVNIMSTGQLATQVAYFASVYAVVAWGRSRQVVALAIVFLGIVIGLWLVIDMTISSSYQDYVDQLDGQAGPFDPLTSYAVATIMVNVAFFGGAVYWGRASWRSALRKHQIEQQAVTIAQQSHQLARRAVVDERLRIARELHDVVAHHVSAIGVQAGAARKLLTRDVQLAGDALRTVEDSSRQAVAETQQLLGVLREDGPEPSAFSSHGSDDLATLVEEYVDLGLAVTLSTAIDDDVDLATLPPALGLSVYRCVQESLANVLRHSTGREVSVVLRSVGERGAKLLELEVLDRGRARGETSGTGFGLVGIQERVQLHGGTCEIGPRNPGPGWRVRARFPVLASTQGAHPGTDRVPGPVEPS